MEAPILEQLTIVSPLFWYAVGIVLIILEVSGVQGIGLFFAGMAAVTLGAVISFDIIAVSSSLSAIALFFLFTVVWAIVLWKPLKKLSKQSKDKKFVDLVGTEAIVDSADGLMQNKTGYVKWSGVRMRARIAVESTESTVNSGQTVWVHGQEDGVLLVDVIKPQITNGN
jgi:membrane protein implicated in regulation of membrane protease activity